MRLNNIILYGFKSCGKTSVGKIIAKTLTMHFIDTDSILEQMYRQETGTMRNAKEIYAIAGEQYFRQLEKSVICSLNTTKDAVIATGGGAVLDAENVVILKKLGPLFYLKTSQQALKDRLKNLQPAFLLNNESKDFNSSFTKMYEARVDIYENIADVVIDTDGKTIEAIAKEIISYFQGDEYE